MSAAQSGRRMRGDAVLFDMDGVLVDSRAVVERTWRRWARRHGVDPEPILHIAHGRRSRESLDLVFPELATDDEVAWLDAAELEDREGLAAMPGASAVLSMLPEGRWGIVTSAGRALAELRLGTAGLPVPAVMVTSDEVPRGKPAPDGYLLGAKRLGVAPGHAVVIEDAPPGLEAACAAGIRAIALTTTHPAERLGAAHTVISDLTLLRVSVEDGELVLVCSLPPA